MSNKEQQREGLEEEGCLGLLRNNQQARVTSTRWPMVTEKREKVKYIRCPVELCV